jgi:hypothetical protein
MNSPDLRQPQDDPTQKDTGPQKVVRAALDIAGSIIPIPGVGGVFSAISGAWSEYEQEQVNKFFRSWLQMLADEIKEKERTVVEIMMRLDMQDEKIRERMSSSEYKSLLKKAFRDWAAAESEEKRQIVRNILSNAAATDIVGDDVIRLFLEWIKIYNEFHIKIISKVYNSGGITRAGIWDEIGKGEVREDSAEADLFKLLIRDLSTGGVIRQETETDGAGNFLRDRPVKRQKGYRASSTRKSAFDDEDTYVLTQLGQQFVHYALTDLPLKIEAPKADLS